MKIFTRTRTIVSAMLHDWFDKMERPEQLARHSLRELADALEKGTAAVALSIATERWLTRRRDELNGQVQLLDSRAAEAVRTGSDAKARVALTQKFAAAESVKALDRQVAEAEVVNRGLRGQLEAMRDRHQLAQQRLDAQTSRHALAVAARQFADAASAVPVSGDLQSALDRLDRSTLELEAQAELVQDVTPIAEAELAQGRVEQFVQDELRRLRGANSGEPRHGDC